MPFFLKKKIHFYLMDWVEINKIKNGSISFYEKINTMVYLYKSYS